MVKSNSWLGRKIAKGVTSRPPSTTPHSVGIELAVRNRPVTIKGEAYTYGTLPYGTRVFATNLITEFRICLPLSVAGYYGCMSETGSIWSFKPSDIKLVIGDSLWVFSLKDEVNIRMRMPGWAFADRELAATWGPAAVKGGQ